MNAILDPTENTFFRDGLRQRQHSNIRSRYALSEITVLGQDVVFDAASSLDYLGYDAGLAGGAVAPHGELDFTICHIRTLKVCC